MVDQVLSARPRTETGKRAGALRRSGEVPAVLYGHNLEPQAIATDAKTLQKVWRQAGRSHLVDLAIGSAKARKVLIRDLQIDPRTMNPIHADFFAVNLQEKIAVDVPIVTTGDAPAVTDLKVGQLLQTLATLKLECLPGDIPAQISVDVTGLTEVDQAIHVRDLALPDGVELSGHVDPDELVVKIAALRVAAVEEEEAPAEGAAEAGAEAADAPSGESEAE
jgi:large subunit ribosomal protein L25